MNVALMIKPNNGCSFYRLILPSNYMPWQSTDKFKAFYPDGVMINKSTLVGNDSEIEEFEPDIIFINGIINKNTEWIKRMKVKGVRIVVDVDDYWELSSLHPVYNMWYKTKSNESIIEYIKLADIVFAVNEQLRKKVLEYNTNCIVIPNAVPFGEPSYRREGIKFAGVKTNFLWSGGSTHYNDLSLLSGKFDRIGQDKWITDRAVFTLAGFNPLPDKHCEWDKMASIIKRTRSYNIVNTLPLEKHLSNYDNADVVLIPLRRSEWNEKKSFLKIIEAATRELPCIVSEVLPYTELKGYPIMWENWIDNIKFCLKCPDKAISMGKELAEMVKSNYDIRPFSKLRYEIFKNLLN